MSTVLWSWFWKKLAVLCVSWNLTTSLLWFQELLKFARRLYHPMMGPLFLPFPSTKVWQFRDLQKIWVDMSGDCWIWKLMAFPPPPKLWNDFAETCFYFGDSLYFLQLQLHYHNYNCKGLFFFFGACCNYVLTSMVGRWISDLEPALLGGFKVNLFRNSAPELESAWKMEGLEDIRRNSFWVVKRPIFSSKSVSFLGTPKTNGELDTQPPMNLARRRWDETPQGRFWP